MVTWRRPERADPRSEAGGRDRSDLDRALADGASADVFIIYSCKALPERNATYEVGKYALSCSELAQVHPLFISSATA
jgi:hypothetical protein